MDIKAFLSSGLLELYVLDEVTDAQKKEVEQYAAKYPEVKKELAQIEETLLLLSKQKAITPPKGLEDLILKKIDDIGKNTPPTSPPSNTSGFGLWTSLLALGFALASGYSFWKNNENSALSQQMNQQKELFAAKETECIKTAADNAILVEQLRFIRSATNQTIRMSGTPLTPDAFATVYYNSTAKKSYLDVNNLDSLPQGKQYQLWAIVDGTPVDMGVFEVRLNSDTLQEIPFVENPQAFAVTIEPEGGSLSPTLDQMVVIGKTS